MSKECRSRWVDIFLKAAWVLSYTLIIRAFHLLRYIEENGKKRDRMVRVGGSIHSSQTLVGALLVSVAVLFLLFGGACSGDPHARAEKHYVSGLEYMKSKKIEEADIEFRRALQLDPSSAKAHYQLALVHVGRRNIQLAYHELTEAVKYDPDYRDAAVQLANLMLTARDIPRAKAQAEEILQKWPDEDRARLIWAECQMLTGASGEARKAILQVLLKNPQDPRAIMDQGLLESQAKNYGAAEAGLRRAWELAPDSESPVAALSELFRVQGQNDKAEAVLKEFVQRQPQSPSALYMLASFYVQQKRTQEAETALRKLRDLARDPQFKDMLARYYEATGRDSEAEREYKYLVSQDKKNVVSAHRYAELLFRTRRQAEARAVVDGILKDNPKDAATLSLRGTMELESGNAGQALLDLQAAQKVDPSILPNYLAQARVYLVEGNLQQAKATLNDALRRDGNYTPARMLLAELEVRTGEVDQAIEDLNKIEKLQPSAPRTDLLLSQALALKGDLRGADTKLTELLNRGVSDRSQQMVVQTLSWVKFRQKKYREAAELARKSLVEDPNSASSLYLLAQTYLAQKQPSRASQVIREYIKLRPDWADAYSVLGSVALQSGDAVAAEDAYKNMLKLAPNSSAALMGLGETYSTQKRVADAIAMYQKLTNLDAKNAFARQRLGQLYEIQADWQNAKSNYEQALVLDPENAVTKNNLAWLYAEHGGNLEVALKLAQEAKQVLPDAPQISDTLAWIYVKKGVSDTALQLLQECIAKDPQNATYQYHMATAYFNLGRLDAAKHSLDLALRNPNFPGAEDAAKMQASLSGK